MPRRNKVLSGQAREMIYRVYEYMKREAEQGVGNVKQTRKRTADATGTSICTVHNILKESTSTEFVAVFGTPGKQRKRNKPVTGNKDLDRGLVRRRIHSYHVDNKESPTIRTLLQELCTDSNFTCSPTSLRRIIKKLGFRWKGTGDDRKILFEKPQIRIERTEYIRQIKKYRNDHRHIVYADVSYIHAGCADAVDCTDATQGTKKPGSKGPSVVVVHAGSQSGFLPNTLLIFKSAVKSGDHVNDETYDRWLRNTFIPNLPPNSVVVVDTTYCNDKLSQTAPMSNSKKSKMEEWLQRKGIEFHPALSKSQLYHIISVHKEKYSQYKIDQLLEQHGHTTLRLPPHHLDLNPVAMIWPAIKDYVYQQNPDNISKVMESVEEKVNLIGKSEWDKMCKKVMEIEDEYVRHDQIIGEMTEENTFIQGEGVSDRSSDDEE